MGVNHFPCLLNKTIKRHYELASGTAFACHCLHLLKGVSGVSCFLWLFQNTITLFQSVIEVNGNTENNKGKVKRRPSWHDMTRSRQLKHLCFSSFQVQIKEKLLKYSIQFHLIHKTIMTSSMENDYQSWQIFNFSERLQSFFLLTSSTSHDLSHPKPWQTL